jgi:hypothetical protein
LARTVWRDNAHRAAKIIWGALGIESDDVVNYVFPKTWPADREQRARIIGEWLRRKLISWSDVRAHRRSPLSAALVRRTNAQLFHRARRERVGR